MRICDLYEKKYDIPTSDKQITGLLKPNKSLQYLGTGCQSIAYLNNKDPNTVIKTIQVSGMDDPALVFIRVCMNNKSNPYFPKIKKAKLYNLAVLDEETRDEIFQHIDPSDAVPDPRSRVVVIVMEKLVPLHSVDTPQDKYKSINHLMHHGILPSTTGTHSGMNYQLMLHQFKTRANRKTVYNTTSDPYLKQALRLMEPLFRKYTPDVTKNNMMVRPNTSPIQVVFLDPIC
jgi:hypothetical protein